MSRLENADISKADAGVNSKLLVDLSKEQSPLSDRANGSNRTLNSDRAMQFSNIYNECCTGMDRSRGHQNRNERKEQQGAASDPKWGAARERLTKSDSQKSEIREKGYRAIQYGDTLSDIAKAHLELKNGGKPASGAEVWKEVERLAKLNNLDPRKNIRPGTKIYMEKCDDQNQQPKPDVQPNTEQPAGPARDSGKDGGGKTDRTPAQLETQPAKPEPNEGRGGGKTTADSPPSSRDSRDIDRDGPKSGIQPGSEVSTDPEVKESDKSEDHPPVNFTPDTPTDETSNHEDTHKSETERIARDQKEREKALHAKEEELKRREEDLKRQLEDLQRQKEELGRREKEVKPCSTKDDTTIWEH